jgi:hypothetical protein
MRTALAGKGPGFPHPFFASLGLGQARAIPPLAPAFSPLLGAAGKGLHPSLIRLDVGKKSCWNPSAVRPRSSPPRVELALIAKGLTHHPPAEAALCKGGVRWRRARPCGMPAGPARPTDRPMPLDRETAQTPCARTGRSQGLANGGAFRWSAYDKLQGNGRRNGSPHSSTMLI